jgi:hypothetical protein
MEFHRATAALFRHGTPRSYRRPLWRASTCACLAKEKAVRTMCCFALRVGSLDVQNLAIAWTCATKRRDPSSQGTTLTSCWGSVR